MVGLALVLFDLEIFYLKAMFVTTVDAKCIFMVPEMMYVFLLIVYILLFCVLYMVCIMIGCI